MGTYQVSFYNQLVNNQGKCCKVLQRAICVEDACDAADAESKAVRRFEQLEGVADWHLHARLLEIQRMDEPVFG
jgi:hypothetical protein